MTLARVLSASQEASSHDSLDCFPTKIVWPSKARCSGYHVSFICFGNISFQGGDTLNLVSGRRLEKHNHHPPKKQELLPNRPLKRPPICVPNPSFFLVVAVVWCARSSKREEVGRFSSFHLTIGHGQLTSHVKMKTLL